MAEEGMTNNTMQIDSALEVPRSEVQTQRIAMNPKLFEAIRSGDKSILDKLLRSEDVSSRASMGEITITVPEDAATQKDTRCLLGVTLEGNTALHIVANRGHLELAKEIYHRERSLLTAQNTRLDTPLHCAARAGDDKMVSLIIQFVREDEIEARRSVLMARNWDGSNALHEAAKYDHVHVAKVLMEEDAELASMLNSANMSPLYLAIVMGSLNVAKALLRSFSWEKASSASYVGFEKRTALHVAVLMSREITEDILQRMPILAKDADCLGRIPLHFVALHGHRDMAKLLLEHDPSTAYVSDDGGFFPLQVATMKGNIGVVDEILKQCPNTVELLDKVGNNFLHIAFQVGQLDVVKKIISKRPHLRELLNDQNNMGNTPLHTAVENCDQRSVNFLLRDKSILPNIINHDGFAPLDLARQNLDPGMSAKTNAASCILSCLAFTKALPGLPDLQPELRLLKDVLSSGEDKGKSSEDDKDNKNSSSSKEEEMKIPLHENLKKWLDEETKKSRDEDLKRKLEEESKKELDVPKNFVIATVLIATVTFAAGFTVPGGYIADDHPGHGTAVLAKEYAFKVFLVSDTFAFVCSILATFWLMDAGTTLVDVRIRRRAFSFAWWCLWVAFTGMSTAFAMGIYATLAHNYKSISILLCIIALGTPLLANMVSQRNFYSFRRTVGIRQGYRHWIWPTAIYPHVENYLHPFLVPRGAIIYYLLPILGSYAIFFLLPKLWAIKN